MYVLFVVLSVHAFMKSLVTELCTVNCVSVDLRRLKCLELSDTEVGSNGLHHLSGEAVAYI